MAGQFTIIEYLDGTYRLWEDNRDTWSRNRDGKVRVFNSKPSVRGTRSRLSRGLQSSFAMQLIGVRYGQGTIRE